MELSEWHEGVAGNFNVVTFNGEDIVGLCRIEDDLCRRWVIAQYNAILHKLQAIEEAAGEFVSVPLSEKAKRKGFHAFIKAMGSEMPRNDDGTYNGSFSHAILVAHYAMLAAKEKK